MSTETLEMAAPSVGKAGGRGTASITKVLGPALFLVLFIAAWQLFSSVVSESRKLIVPSPGSVFRVGFWSNTVCKAQEGRAPACEHVRSDILHAILQTSKEAGLGLLVAFIIGTLFAIVMSQTKLLERAFFPWAVALQTIPILALVPFIQIRFGYELKSRVIVCVIIAVFPILTNTLFGLQSADDGHHDLFTLHRASRLKRLVKLQLPGALPAIFTGLRISAGLSVVGAIVGEFFFRLGDPGLGHKIENYRRMVWAYDIPSLYATVIYTCLLGVLVFVVFTVAGNLSTRSWYETADGAKD